MPSMATTYHESSPTSGTGSGIESDGLKVGLDTSTGPYCAKGQTLRWNLTLGWSQTQGWGVWGPKLQAGHGTRLQQDAKFLQIDLL